MNDFITIIEILKKHIAEDGVKSTDKRLAAELGINQINFASLKKRNKIPFKEVLNFCVKNKILINDVLFNQKLGLVDA